MRVRSKPPITTAAPHPHGYGAQFILLDLTDGPLHQLRLAAVDAIAEHDPASLAPGYRRPSESHVSVVTIPAPTLPAGAREHPTGKGREGWAAVVTPRDLNLRVASSVGYLEIPREGPKTHTVAYLAAHDHHGTLAKIRREYQSAVGEGSLSAAPLHLTLATLPLGAHLSPAAEKAISQLAQESASAEGGRLVFSGRYGCEFAAVSIASR